MTHPSVSQVLKSKASLLAPDPRNDQRIVDLASGTDRAMSIEDLHGLMEGLELGLAVPAAIRRQFDVARNAFVYSWFEYELVTLAEQHSYGVVESALRERIVAAGGDVPKLNGLKALYEHAFKHGHLNRDDFDVASPFNPSESISLFEFVRMLRNNLAHGHTHLLPNGSLQMMRLCADILTRLYSPRATRGQGAQS
jgi:hypothetical protein